MPIKQWKQITYRTHVGTYIQLTHNKMSFPKMTTPKNYKKMSFPDSTYIWNMLR